MFSKALIALLAIGAQQAVAHPAFGHDLEGRSDAHHAPVISYADETGQSWGGLCKTGKRQSPIDLHTSLIGDKDAGLAELAGSNIKFSWPNQIANISNHGPAVYVEDISGSMTVASKKYNLKQFHFHTPSEHWIDSKTGAMEVHFVHLDENDATKPAVVGALIELADGKNTPNPVIETALKKVLSVPDQGNKTKTDEVQLTELAKFFASASFFTYDGSLTTPTPDCSEGVKWHVAKQRLYASKVTLDNAAKIMKMNARWVTNQPSKDMHRGPYN